MESQVKYKEKSVIIHRDENGFGLRVGGQNPVFVDFVHENGAAWKAGVRKDDRIIKVNGTLVRSFDHQHVVHMIQNCTPFVNLTLHSPEPIMPETFTVLPCVMQSVEPTMSGGIILSNNNPNSNLGNNNLKVEHHQRLHHSASNISDWLLNISDDLFQDNQHKPQSSQKQQVNQNTPSLSPSQHSGLSKLIASGTSPILPINPLSSSAGKTKLKQNLSQTNIRDNPYYYYKNASDKNESSACVNANSSMISQEGTSKTGSSLSIVRSRSSSKMSIRSTTGKYKPRNLRSRLVEDLRSLAITNTQATPSSLSTSPSSSDLSDCDDADSSRLDCLSVSTSNTSASGINPSLSSNRSPSCTSTVTSQSVSILNPKYTTRRLEIIRELIDTEKTHTERLKHLNDLLYKPIKAENLVPLDQLKMVFSCHKTLFKIHRQIYKILHSAQVNIPENHHEPLIGKALVEIFEGELGRRLETAASTFCACQSTNTELLNRFTRKDTKAGEFLAQVANQQMLGRLGIKDLLASCFQRLTKYPLLLENLLKATPVTCGFHTKSLSEGSIATNLAATMSINTDPSEETTNDSERQQHQRQTVHDYKTVNSSTNNNNNNNDESTTTSATPTIDDEYAYERLCISRALNQTRLILTRVNEAVNRAISHNQLREIWKKTDKYPSLPVIDIETQQLLHEGPLTLRLARRTFEVYVLLLTHYLVILTREGQDKYKLKYFTADNKLATQFSPIFNIDEHLATRDTATDENGFYLLCKRKDDSRIYEFASQSPAERAKWKEKIHMAMAQLYNNFTVVPDDDNTLTRYRDLIPL